MRITAEEKIWNDSITEKMSFYNIEGSL